MKKIPFALVLALGLASGSAFAASSGTITINGKVVDQTCTIVGETDKTVNLATVSKELFTNAGDTAAPQAFTIGLESCAVDNVYAAFSADSANLIDEPTHTLRNTANSEAAVGVNIALFEADGTTQIRLADPLYNSTAAATTEVTGDLVGKKGTATLVYSAAYYATVNNADIILGDVKAIANYIISYK